MGMPSLRLVTRQRGLEQRALSLQKLLTLGPAPFTSDWLFYRHSVFWRHSPASQTVETISSLSLKFLSVLFNNCTQYLVRIFDLMSLAQGMFVSLVFASPPSFQFYLPETCDMKVKVP